ncbi:MAG: pantetheine-phosphate adenylyltransferase [Acidobacteria bacterium]|nr:pantetheine-phosphate adenylyltransferase [Acidobacteriota bacterium]
MSTSGTSGARLAIYPGSFDPITNGHVDIIERGLRLFDRVIVAVLKNEAKAPLFSAADRVQLVRDVFGDVPGLEVDTFDGLLVDYAAARGASVIVKGLRSISDYEHESQMAQMNRRLRPAVETMFLMPAETYAYTSSRLIKEVCRLGGDIRGLVPPVVEVRLQRTFAAARDPHSAPRHV